MADDFFQRFAAIVGAPAAAAPVGAPATAGSAPAAPAPEKGRLAPAVWVAGLAVIVVILLYFFVGRGG
jgi:hypothetical protein